MIVLFLKGENYNFKTSHVIVYLEELDNEKEKDVHFKTSHVIVYLRYRLEMNSAT